MNSKELDNLTPKELKSLQQFKMDSKRTKIELQNIRKQLRSKLDNTKATIIFLDVALIPILLLFIGIVVGIIRKRRHKININLLKN